MIKGTTRLAETSATQPQINSELLYRRVFESAQDGILILDAETGAITDVNPFLINMLGYSREEFVTRKLWEVGAFRDIEASQDAFKALQENAYIRYEDLPLKTKDGRLIQVEFVSNVFLVDTEKVIQCNIRDITEHRRLIVALQNHEKKYHDLVNLSPDGIFIIEFSGKILAVNPAMCRELDFSEAEFLAMNIWDIIPEHFLDQYRTRLTHILAGESIGEADEYTVCGKDGKIHYIEVLSAPHYSDKHIIGFQGIARDVTAHKRAEFNLQESEMRFRRLIEQLPTVVYMNSAAGDHSGSSVSPQIESLLGYSPTEWLADPDSWTNTLHPDDRQRILAQAAGSDHNGKPLDMEYRMIARDGHQVWVHDRVVQINNLEGQLQSRQGIMIDITERKKAEEKIRRQLEQLTALSAIDRVIASNFDIKQSLAEILNHVTIELGVDAADILIFNTNSQMLEFGAERGFRTQAIREAKVRLGESYAGRAALERELVQIINIRDDSGNVSLAALLDDEDFVCYYGVPLITKGQVKGVLEVFQRAPHEPDAEWLDFLTILAGRAAIAIENAMLFESLQRSNLELTLAYEATIEGWSHALDLRDKETEGHTQRVTEMTLKLASAFGLSVTELVQVRWGALLHDIGKMGVPDGILLKSSPLTEEEWVVMKKHPIFAYEMLSPILYLRLALDIPYCHHEKWDGSGYPHGLEGNQIPLIARIFAVVDVWDALSSDRPYRPAWSQDKIHDHIQNLSGSHFDPVVVDKFLGVLNGTE